VLHRVPFFPRRISSLPSPLIREIREAVKLPPRGADLAAADGADRINAPAKIRVYSRDERDRTD
jgi:hypothetical protein